MRPQGVGVGVAAHQRGPSGFDGGGKRDDGAASFAAGRRRVSSRYRAQQWLDFGVGGGAGEFFLESHFLAMPPAAAAASRTFTAQRTPLPLFLRQRFWLI